MAIDTTQPLSVECVRALNVVRQLAGRWSHNEHASLGIIARQLEIGTFYSRSAVRTGLCAWCATLSRSS